MNPLPSPSVARPRRAGGAILSLVVLSVLLAAPPVLAKKKKGDDEAPAKAGKSRAELLKDTEALSGLFVLHRGPEKLYLELPADLVGAPLGYAAVQVRSVGDFSPRGGALETQLVTWERVDDHLVLYKENTDFRAAAGSAYGHAVRESFPRSPIFSARLERLSDEPAPLIVDASKLFNHELTQIVPAFLGATARPDGTVLESLKAFADNVTARLRFHFQQKPGGAGADDAGGFARFLTPSRLPDRRNFEVTVDFNFFRLPADGYRPRWADDRIGGFALGYKDYSDVDERDTAFRHLLLRFDLRKADPAAAVSPPVEPITFHLDRSIPEEWRPLVREGTLWWNEAFEKIGIRDAVRVLDAPDDPEWDAADVRHSVIYWNLSDNLVFSGMAGPSLVDPRTGQALNAGVYLNGEFFSFARHRYLVYAWWRAPEPGGSFVTQAEALRELRRRPNFCDRAASFSSQMAFARLVLTARGVLQSPGEADRFARDAFLELVAHEVGHALGFPHNWKASLTSTWDDVAGGRTTGSRGERPFSSSVMDYNPIYLAPAGAPQGDYFLDELGAYDELALEYLYRPFDGASPEAEAAELDRIAARAETELGLVYDGGELNAIDPTTNSDDLGDDPLAFAASRLAMIHAEVLPELPRLVLAEGHDYSHLRAALDPARLARVLDNERRETAGERVERRLADRGTLDGYGEGHLQDLAARIRRTLEAGVSLAVVAEGGS